MIIYVDTRLEIHLGKKKHFSDNLPIKMVMCASYVCFFRADSRRAIGPTTGLCNLAILIILQLDRLAGRNQPSGDVTLCQLEVKMVHL